MNKFWLYLSVYLFSLSVYPCSDSTEINSVACETMILNVGTHDKNHDETEHCAPFCSCVCCGVYTLHIVNFISIEKAKLFFYEKVRPINCYAFSYHKKISTKIWQPPKWS